MTTIFISYRRSDDPYAARSINNALCKQFGKENVYFDLDALLAGLDWREQIDKMVAQCDVMLVVIGDDWLQVDESGRSRLEDEDDLVLFEVSSALNRDIPVIPVLVGKATIPVEDSLPAEIQSLVYRQAVEVRATANFNAQIENLLRSIETVAPEATEPKEVAPEAPTSWRRLKPIWRVSVIVPVVAVIAVGLSWQPLMNWASKNEQTLTGSVDATQPTANKQISQEDQLADKSESEQEEPATPSQGKVETEPGEERKDENPYKGIKVTSQPPGANIFIEGALVGITPASLSGIERGRTATIRLHLEGYEPSEQAFTAPHVGLGEVSFTLQKIIQKYALIINPEPVDVKIKFLSTGQEYQPGVMLVPGRYHVELSREGFITQTQWLEIESRDLSQSIVLEPEKPEFVAGQELEECDECPEMVVIPAGSFVMGGSLLSEKPQHGVSVPKFAMGKYEVTFNEYVAFARSTGRDLPEDEGWGRGKRPVFNVWWDDAQEYVEWLSLHTGKKYRLPSEAEWEYATRAGTQREYWWGDEIKQDGKVWANCSGCGSEWGGKKTYPVGEFLENHFGLYDMAGNVYEWVKDCWHDDYQDAPDDGSVWLEADDGDCTWRVIRGGSWANGAGNLRSAYRHGTRRNDASELLGFRVARDLD